MKHTSKSEQVRQMHAKFPELPLTEIAKRVGVNNSTAHQALRGEKPKETTSSLDISGDTATAESKSPNVKTLDDLLKYLEVDLSVWEVERHVVNKWEVGAKDENKKVQVTQLFQVKAWLRRKMRQSIKETFVEMLEEFKKEAPKRPAVIRDTAFHPERKLLEVSLFDLHFGKLCWHAETGMSYDLKIARETLDLAVDNLLAATSKTAVGRILLPVGNDFFNVDSRNNATSAGTPQDCDGRWQKSFIEGRKAMVDTIERLRKVAPVDVVMISGNHDIERVFYLGDVLSAWFSKTPGVSINNDPTQRKYYRWGKCLLGFTHGNEEKHADLPLLMASERAVDWGATQFREFHVGHFHKKKEMRFVATDEFRDVRVRVIPSLCPPDAWHVSKGYGALMSAEAFVWDSERGCIATFSHQP